MGLCSVDITSAGFLQPFLFGPAFSVSASLVLSALCAVGPFSKEAIPSESCGCMPSLSAALLQHPMCLVMPFQGMHNLSPEYVWAGNICLRSAH